ncbi:plasma membrane localization protein [Pleosporales sp. CAS-2024a]
MQAARQAYRSKHQVLVLKCYPKFQKNNADVRANSSELSYLLYYASTRRSKLQKVGDFLDKRATKDVAKGSAGGVRVTLQIVKALIEKCPRDLPLYAGAVLRVLRTVVASSDVTMVEESVPTFEALCAHQDPAALAADHDYLRQYHALVQLYAAFASKESPPAGKTPMSWPVAIRYRKAGLQALKAVASSESLASETGRQLALIIPAMLLNMHAESGAYLARLKLRETRNNEHEKEHAQRRQQSVSTARTDEDEGGDAIAAEGTTEDADKLAEEEVGELALQALRNLFQGVNRGQLRLATSTVLSFIATHVATPQHLDNGDSSWATTLMATICAWAPVQDRYAILVGAVETLVRSPIVEHDLERQLLLASVIDHLLASNINFIGLSVMDVLVGLISHTLLLLQLGGPGSSIVPHHQQTTSAISEKAPPDQDSSKLSTGVVMEVTKEPSQARFKLLDTMQKCMADLATHVYYTDQISDMVEAILSRLKPSRISSIFSTAEAPENPTGTVDGVADSAGLQEKTHVDRFFSFETARVTALESVKHIIKTANTRRPDGSSASISRSRVGVSVWEGTQWLLRDPSGRVRKAYVDAMVTWLNLEKQKQDLKIVENYKKKEQGKNSDKVVLARRAVSNASQRERVSRSDKGKDTFLPLLHLAVYENALFYVDSQADYLLLHLLLTTLVNKLGVNAVRSGLPMIMRLQEDIATIEDPGTKVRIGSLVHGYFWALSLALDFEVSSVGRSLQSEIARRTTKGLWVKSIRVPPMPADQIETPHPNPIRLPGDIVDSEALNPFDNREALVEKIFEGYSSSLCSPPSSPPTSSGRSMSISSVIPAIHQPTASKPAPQLPFKVREELLANWSRDLCLTDNTKGSSSASMTASRSGTQHTKNNYLGVNIPNSALDSENNSPVPSPRRAPSKPPSAAYGLVGRHGSPQRDRSPSRTPGSSSSQRSTVRVDDLKRALSGSGPHAPKTSYSLRALSQRYRTSGDHDSSASDSLVSVHSLSDASFMITDRTDAPHIRIANGDGEGTPAATPTPRPQTANSTPSPRSPLTAAHYYTHMAHDKVYAKSGVPPVPPIPESLRDKSTSPNSTTGSQDFTRPKTAPNGSTVKQQSRSVKSGPSRGRSGDRRTRRSDTTDKKPDFSQFLDSIDVDDDDAEGGTATHGAIQAPY